ncbi:hypothetical protein GBAR_LOCUS19948 [Geodia barretti]|uniref:Alpha/beta hydrolase domain-containing protein n=1 Tax=Geodia barretti TaxID=519541 RepID=A0AA35WWN5_GEOBA|nr:hypothetical protein GBAR_LOCUS19948 [Geodia barretti]
MAVTRLEVHSIRPFAGGSIFGETGPYRQIDGLVHLAVDPDNPANEVITDINLAPRDAAGRVHCSADFTILQPEDPSRGSHRIVFDVVNRGNPTILTNLNSAGQRLGAGNGFLMRHGYTVVWCGWQYDVPPGTPTLVKAYVPEALNPDGSSISGRIAIGFQPHAVTCTHTLADRLHRPHPTSDIDDPDATLVVREHQDGPAEAIPRDQWSFARLDGEEVVADSRSVYLAAGFQPGKVYEITYTTTGADVVGMGMLGPRDLVSFLRYGSAEAGNPCAGDIEYAFTFGRSQSGGFLRRFLYCGLTQDEEDRPVFEGLIPLVAGSGRGEMNQRFGQPSTPARPSAGRSFPFHDTLQTDPDSGRTDGLLARLDAAGKTPRVLLTNTSAEYWSGHASLIHTTMDGTADLGPSDNVRIYHYAGTQHGPGQLNLFDVDVREGPRGQQLDNSVDYRPLLRAALKNVERWVTEGSEPPASRHPRLDDGTAVPAPNLEATFRAIPEVNFPEVLKHVYRADFGPEAHNGLVQPAPGSGEPYPNFVPAVDSDGNEVTGIRLPDVTVPLATYAGWNLRHPDSGAPGQIMPQIGSTIPFPATRADREASGDPRLSIEERYASREEFLDKVRQEGEKLVAEGYMLAEDLDTVKEQASQRYDSLIARRSEVPAATDD